MLKYRKDLGGVYMLFRKQMNSGTKNDVAFANGAIRFQSEKLNVYSYVIRSMGFKTYCDIHFGIRNTGRCRAHQ